MKILLIDDSKINLVVAGKLIKEYNPEITECESGQEALDKVSQAPDKYDIIFMDMQMPVMDGLEATRQIRFLPDCDTIPIVAMTANVFRSDIEKCIAVGMNDHLGKPLYIEKVLETLRKYLSI